ncbi:DUF4097 family beta strand repeat-containing protein [Saccharothrix obliqua]|uniref:DUF4097 family beta strand repeat-containing protein n=1 Tax=Saccharothrix obliqua TaxID=2861747 RepID=UPI001C5D3192|nr:DUF4097 family beta strand repeat-containing protein [Saccharothrix obliqua]MBW4715603.1 DUF4097 domain-containing protein [Saccharothrix obliqua]
MGKRIALAAVAAVLATGSLSSCVSFVENTFNDRHEVTEKVSTVRIHNGAGDVRLRGSEGVTTTEVKRVVEYPKGTDEPRGVTHRVEGDTLVLDGCGRRCSVNYEVTVPTLGVKVVGDNGSGDVTLEGVASVEVEVGSGDLVVRNVSGPVSLDSGSGDVTVTDVGEGVTARLGSGGARLAKVRGPVRVDNSSGDVDVELAAVQSVRAETGSGNLTVRVPRGGYRVEVSSGSGDVRKSDLVSDPGASAELVLRSGSGDVALSSAA